MLSHARQKKTIKYLGWHDFLNCTFELILAVHSGQRSHHESIDVWPARPAALHILAGPTMEPNRGTQKRNETKYIHQAGASAEDAKFFDDLLNYTFSTISP